MKLTQMKKMGLVLVTLLATTSLHANYNQTQAKMDCAQKIAESGKYQLIDSKRAVDQGHHSYKVTGVAESVRNGDKYKFNCSIRHKELVNWRVVKASNHSDKDSAIAAGAGLLAVLAIAAAANDDKHHNNRHENHATGGSAFDDMRYLKKQCKQNIRRHIAHDDQAVKKIHLDTTHLNRRTLRGEGGVLFKRGGGSDISYECKFDRQGRIYDGHYRFH